MNIEILQNTKGNPKIVCDGYMYNKSRTLKSGRISWRCERKGTKCTGAITTCSAMADPKVERPHNHDARPAAADALKARNQAKEVARATGENPAAVINAARANAQEAARVLMGPDTALKRMVQRVRSKETPRTPDSLEELTINGAWAQTSSENPEQFMFYDNGDGNSRIIIFGSRCALDKLASADT